LLPRPSKDKGVYTYNYDYGQLDFPEPLKYCQWCGTKIELISKGIETLTFC